MGRQELALKFLPAGDSLLDIGCGEGGLIFKAKNKFNKVLGIDINIKKESAFLKKVDINEGLPFNDKSFDVIVCISVLQFVLDPYSVVQEISRILKPSGILILNIPNIVYLKNRMKLLFGIFPRTSLAPGWDGKTLHYFCLRSIKTLLWQNGLEIKKVSGSGKLAGIRNWWPSLLTGDLMIKAKK